MTDLYVANCTRQVQIVCFRHDFNERGQAKAFSAPRQREIKPGQQERIARGEHIDTVTAITEQLGVFGMRPIAEVSRLTDKDYVPVVYNVDRAVPSRLIRDVMDHNNRVRMLQGAQLRKQAAVVSNDLITKTVQEELLKEQMPAEMLPKIEETTVEYDQQNTTEENQTRLGEGVRVRGDAPDAELPPPQQRRGRGSRQRARATG